MSCQTNATASSLVQTQNQLKKVDQHIGTLEHSIQAEKQKKISLIDALKTVDQNISHEAKRLFELKLNMTKNQNKVHLLQQKTKALETKLSQQENMLNAHLKARYQLGEYEPLKWLLNQENPEDYSRVLTLYQYLLQSRLQLITTTAKTRGALISAQTHLEHELAEQQTLHQASASNQKKLAAHKLQEEQLVAQIETSLSHHQRSLNHAKKDKENLARLLKNLSQKSIVQPRYPMARMQRKLPKPIEKCQAPPKSMNHGFFFKASEGTMIRAVYPGRVVFSDWLNGYGLLTIIDHGQGMMSLYAHQQSLFKNKGDSIALGEAVGTVGKSGGNRETGLYFEIRQRGRAVSPSQWLA